MPFPAPNFQHFGGPVQFSNTRTWIPPSAKIPRDKPVSAKSRIDKFKKDHPDHPSLVKDRFIRISHKDAKGAMTEKEVELVKEMAKLWKARTMSVKIVN